MKTFDAKQKTNDNALSFLGLLTWILAALFFLYEFFLRTSIGSLAHQIIPELHLTAENFATLGSAYAFTYGIMQIPVGIIIDKFNLKWVMSIALLICAASIILFAHSNTFHSAFFSRLLMGFGSSFAFLSLLVIANTWFPRQYFGFFAGTSQFIGTMGPLLAGGPFVIYINQSHESWRSALDEIGLIGIILAIVTFLIVRSKSCKTLKSSNDPLVSSLLKLAKNKQSWFVAIYSAAQYAPMAFLGVIWGTEYLQTRGLTQSVAADIISLAWLGYAVGCPLLGGTSDMLKRRKPILILSATVGLILTSLIICINSGSAEFYAVIFFLIGLSASAQNVGFAAVSEHVHPNGRATAMGLTNAMITVFIVLTPVIASNFIDLKTKHFSTAFLAMPILFLISLVLSACFIRETFCKPQKQ